MSNLSNVIINSLYDFFVDFPIIAGATIVLTALSVIFILITLIKRARFLENIPISTIRGATQGYVALKGRGFPLPGHEVISPVTHQRCLWYSYHMIITDSDGNAERYSGVSDGSFILDDGTDRCVVDVHQAEIIGAVASDWVPPLDDYSHKTYTEKILEIGAPLYIVGEFITISNQSNPEHDRIDLDQKLTQWKKDYPQLLARFDANKDGKISQQEWEYAVSVAEKELLIEKAEATEEKLVSIIRKPSDKKPFIISAKPKEQVTKRYRKAGLFVIVVLIIVWILMRG